MSLLLDALKKAADEKQKLSQGENVDETATKDVDVNDESVSASTSDIEAEATSVEVDNDQQQAQESIQESTQEPSNQLLENAVELTLDDIDTEGGPGSGGVQTGSESTDADEAALESDSSIPELTIDNLGDDRRDQVVDYVADDNSRASAATQEKSKASSYTISDDALSMLIYKTNTDVRRGNKLLISGVLLASMLVLVAGGVYYYLDMQAEIANLERKHQIAMQSMRSKTSDDNVPEQSEIIRNLVSDADLDEKVDYAKKHMPSDKSATASTSANRNARAASSYKAAGSASSVSVNNTDTSSGSLSIQRTNKSDPVGEKLDQAWLAYEAGRYDEAKGMYDEVLRKEKNNRDALLGLGAIAVIEKNSNLANQIYMSLLKLDPRDPIATAAIASLRNDESNVKQDEDYLLSMIDKNPDDPHLNFALGNVYAQQGRWKIAQQQYFNAWQHDVDNADYVFNLAVSMDQLSKPEQAISFYQDSLKKADNKQVSFSREAVQKRIEELSEL